MQIYARKGAFHGRLAVNTIREHLCGFYTETVACANAGVRVDSETGHTVCCECNRITVSSGLRECDICEEEYIDLNEYQNPRYDTNCRRCVQEYGL